MTKEEAFHILMHMEKYIEWDKDFGAAILAPLMDATVMALRALKADAVEVVYCQDCARCMKGFCTIRKDSWGATLKVGLHDFCSYGERKDNAAT